MCKVSNKLKLCTFNTDINSLKHYWILHRFEKDKNDIVIGQTILPAAIDPQTDAFNKTILVTLLNEPGTFDAEITPAEKDRLEISFTVGAKDDGRIFYGFEFKNNKWEAEEFDPLMWMWNHNEEKSGKIKNAFLRKTKNIKGK